MRKGGLTLIRGVRHHTSTRNNDDEECNVRVRSPVGTKAQAELVRRSTQPLKLSVDSTRRGSGERESFLMVFRSHLFDPSDVGPVLTQSHPYSNHHLLPPSPPPYTIPMSRIHHYPFTYSATTSSNLLLLLLPISAAFADADASVSAAGETV